MRLRLFAVVALVVGALVAITAAPAQARETILSFDSHIIIEPDGTLLVTETIRVNAEGSQIRRGIFRDFPVRTTDENGLRRTVGFRVLEVLKNGQTEPWRRERVGAFARVYIGDADVWLDPGVYTYTLRYETTRQLLFLDNFDEIAWNATGTEWVFPILEARARIILPEGAEALRTAAYTGRYGETGREATIELVGDRTVRFETTRSLQPYEGLTVAVGFTKGVIPEPGLLGRAFWLLMDNFGQLVLVLGVSGIGLYYVGRWQAVGRDPEPGVIIPIFEPPDGLSPAALSYIFYRGFRGSAGGAGKALIAALVSLGVRGRVQIASIDKKFQVKAVDGRDGPLPEGEQAVFDNLFSPSRRELRFEKTNAKIVRKTVSAFTKAITTTHGGKYFRQNIFWAVLGFLMSVALVIGFLVLHRPREEFLLIVIIYAITALLGAGAAAGGIRRIRGFVPDGSAVLGWFLLALGAAILFALLAGLLVVWPLGSPVVLLFVIALAIINAAFGNMLGQVLPEGQRTLEEIEGFRLYLTVAEKERLNLPGAPDLTEDLFERYLPYAIGLGVEKPWSDAFTAELARLGKTETTYHPSWYSGGDWRISDLGRETGKMASALGSGVSSAMPSKSSGSSSGGGGFSGGGGGGGGGGGW